MAEAKPIASLSSSLLARKGHAKPAMRPQGFANFGYNMPHATEDLGWNDMGETAPALVPHIADVVPIAPATAPVSAPIEPPLVLRQQDELERIMAPSSPEPPAPAPVVEAVREPVPGGHERRRDSRARDAVAVEVERTVAVVRALPGSKAKAAFTLRLDPARHLKLRLAGAVAHRSSQAIVLEALDTYLSTQARVLELADEAVQRSTAATPTGSGDAR